MQPDGLLENIYRTCLVHELTAMGMNVVVEAVVPIHYKNVVLDGNYRLDVMVNDNIVIELKSVDHVLPVHCAQLLSYLRLTKKPLELLIKFNVPRLAQGVRRIVNRPGLSLPQR
jgi:GxxExxY protein